MTIKHLTHNTLILYFEQKIDEEVLEEVQRAYQALKPLKGLIDLTPSYTSLLLQYDFFLYDFVAIEEAIKQQIEKTNGSLHKTNKHILIPTNYKENLDLKRVANYHQLSIEEVIKLHTQTTYRVYSIGFMVGFAYLATIHPKIATPRVSSPRAKVPKGAVAIADNQTAIYPQDSAGGWNIIGQTEFYDFESFEIGDTVEFVNVF